MALPTTTGKRGERGFTLAGLIVILTVMMIFIAYTVPRQWSTILQRDREKQTIFIMKQYAAAIDAFSRKNGSYPINIDQLKQARAPRFLRGPKSE
ncbi:MAG TPA: type II secretion system protein, partial [Thermoanaerobaculia bacterium]|nr:type II secretion system protein [Thermoanaerobaculia bacterium]